MKQNEIMLKVKTAIKTGVCPYCGKELNVEQLSDGGWSLTCSSCHWACGGSGLI
jgi:ribosomal protein L37AE/L43A